MMKKDASESAARYRSVVAAKQDCLSITACCDHVAAVAKQAKVQLSKIAQRDLLPAVRATLTASSAAALKEVDELRQLLERLAK